MGFCGGGPFRRYATDRSLLASRHHEWTQAQAHYDPGAYKRFSVGLPLLLQSRICTQPRHREAGRRNFGPRLQGGFRLPASLLPRPSRAHFRLDSSMLQLLLLPNPLRVRCSFCFLEGSWR
jgi:hypothetical protein